MQRPPTIGVLALQGDVRAHRHALEAAGARTTTVRRESDLDRIDGLVLPGGESTTISRLLCTFDLLEPLRLTLKEGLPAYGSCAGMVLLAETVAGGGEGVEPLGILDITVQRNAFGRQVDSFEADLRVRDLEGGPMRAVFIRAPWVDRVGSGVDVLATVPSGPAAGRVVAVRRGDVFATSFHPEVTGDARFHGLLVEVARRSG